MRVKNFLLIPALAITTWFAFTGMAEAQTEILTFDDLPNPGNGGDDPIPGSYGGLLWQNFYYLNGSTIPNSGYANGIVSPSNVVFNTGGLPALVRDGAFNLNSAYLTGAWNNGLQVEVQGFVGNTLTYDRTYTVNETSPTLVNFNYTGVDEVNFISSGGTPVPGIGGSGVQFVMDNLSITLVPEPSAFALIGLASILLIFRCLPHRSHRRALIRTPSSAK
jgi:hypothetical protein